MCAPFPDVTEWCARSQTEPSNRSAGEPGCDLLGDCLGHIGLQRQDIAQFALIAFTPEVNLVSNADELGGNAHAVIGAAHAAVHQECCPEFFANLSSALGRQLV